MSLRKKSLLTLLVLLSGTLGAYFGKSLEITSYSGSRADRITEDVFDSEDLESETDLQEAQVIQKISIPDITEIDIEEIGIRTRAESVLLQSLADPSITVSYRSEVPPPSSASVPKVIIAELILARIESGQLAPEDTLSPVDWEVAAFEEDYLLGQVLTVDQAMGKMLTHSSNATSNLLIRKLGGPEDIVKLSKDAGYINTDLSVYFSSIHPGYGRRYSTLADNALAMQRLYESELAYASSIQSYLETAEREVQYDFGVARKLGINSFGSGEIAVIDVAPDNPAIDGRFIVGAFVDSPDLLHLGQVLQEVVSSIPVE